MKLSILVEIYNLIFRVVPKKIKRNLLLTQFIIIINAIVQIILALLFVPFISLIVDQKKTIDHMPGYLKNYVLSLDSSIIAYLASFFFVLLIFTSLIFSILNDRTVFKTSGKIKTFIQTNLFRTFLEKDYVYYSRVNSAQISKTINEESNKIDQLTFSFLNLISNSLILFFFLALFFLFDLEFTLILILLSSLVFVYNKYVISKKVISYGNNIGDYFEKRTKLLSESIEGIKEVKVNRLESYLIEYFEDYTHKFNSVYVKYNIIQNIPKYIIIFILYLSIVLMLLLAIVIRPDDNILNKIVFFGISSLRVIPAIQALTTAMVSINFHKSVLVILKNENINYNFKNIANKVTTKSFSNNNVSLQNVCFKYDISKSQTLHNVSFEITGNGFVGITGPSGSGKTTLVNIILGLLKPQTGKVFIKGNEFIEGNVNLLSDNIAYVPQQTFLFDDTINNNIFLNSERDTNKLNRSLDLACCDFIKNDFLKGETVGERGIKLSGGQKQRLGIARALYSDASIIIFDESTSALDFKTESLVMSNLKQLSKEKIFFFISHKESSLEYMDHIIEVNNGNVIFRNNYSKI